MCCIMCQCFGVGTSYGSWLGLTTHVSGWDVTGSSILDMIENIIITICALDT
jgi:hypothetical protein